MVSSIRTFAFQQLCQRIDINLPLLSSKGDAMSQGEVKGGRKLPSKRVKVKCCRDDYMNTLNMVAMVP